MFLLIWFLLQILGVFIITSIINKLLVLLFHITRYFFFFCWLFYAQWLFYIIAITFVRGLLILFIYTVTTLKKEHNFFLETPLWGFLLIVNLLLIISYFNLSNVYSFGSIVISESKNIIIFILKNINYIIIIKILLILSLILINSRIILKIVRLALRSFKRISR